jgi:hypothetical protein
MNGSPGVVVNKGGFLSSLAKGLFGTIMVIVLCGTALGLYGLRIADTKATLLTNKAEAILDHVLQTLPRWQEAMPPQIADALLDRRAPDYRDSVEVNAWVTRDGQHSAVVIEVDNKGDEIISMLPVRVVVEDDEGTPVFERSIYAVTPLNLGCDEWPGPLWPKSPTRKIRQHAWRLSADSKVTVEITDLRVALPTAKDASLAPPPTQAQAAMIDSYVDPKDQ